MRLLLISSSRPQGYEYLGHCRGELVDFLGSVKRVLNIPYAAPRPEYLETSRRAWSETGFEMKEISESDPASQIAKAEAIFVCGGNTFRLLNILYRKNLLGPIRERVLAGMPYMGASAGLNVACLTIQTTNDMPIVIPPSLEALGLVPFQINPHYFEPVPDEPRRGETRAERLLEFLEENNRPVLGLQESAWLRREENKLLLGGEGGATLFRRGREPEKITTGADLSFLLERFDDGI